jgi:peptidoglycan/LPS O-acetylase OafA/YrhL
MVVVNGMENKKYYKTLDIIRVLSCVAVFLYHLNILEGGYLAVCVFFVLSGYLACNSAFRKDKFSFKDYYLNRLKHIYIPLLFVVFLSILVISFIPSINWLTLKPETISVLGGYNNYWQINANMDYFARHINSPFMHFWYIAILLQFEIIFPFIFILLKKIGDKTTKSIPVIILFLLTIGSTIFFYISSIKDPNIMNTYYNSLTRVFSILFGMFMGFILHYYKNYIPIKNSIIRKIIFCLYLVILIILFIFIDSKSSIFHYAMILSTLITCRLIDYSNIFISPLNKLDKVIKYFANISYEVYLFQYPVIFIFQYIVLKDYLKLPLIFIITIILSIILHFILSKKKNVFKYILLIIVTITSLFGVYKFIIEEDHTEEMNALKEQLGKNEEDMKLKQKEYQEKLKRENEEYENKLKELENGSSNLEEVVYNLPIVGVGDSVMLGAVPRLYKTFGNGYFDAKVSRTDYEATAILRELANKGMLSDIVVIHLGTNGTCGNKCRDQMLDVIGDRKVFWLTVSNDYDVHVNARLKEYVNNHPNSYIVDWEAAGIGHPEYFAADKIHLNSSGITAYCSTIYNAIYEVYKEEYEIKKQEFINNHNNELKSKITFYGNDLLINGFNKEFDSADFVMDKEFTYNKLVDKIKNNKPNYNVVLVFDNSFRLSNNQYKNIINLLKDNKVYIVKMNDDKVNLDYENVTIIDFNKEIIKNNDYLMVDNIHLTEKGNNKLEELLKDTIKK